jgi:hypothetical protein
MTSANRLPPHGVERKRSEKMKRKNSTTIEYEDARW